MKQKSTEGHMTISEVSTSYGLSTAWTRRMVHQDKVEYIRVQVGDTEVSRIEINLESLDAYRAESARAHRSDGRTKYALYASDEELEQLQSALAGLGLELPIGRANPPKSEQKEKDLAALKDSVASS